MDPPARNQKLRKILQASVAGSVLLFGTGLAYVSAQNLDEDGLDAIFAAEDENPCTGTDEDRDILDVEDAEGDRACGNGDEKSDAAESEDAASEIDLGMSDDDDGAQEELSAEDVDALRDLSDDEANEVATLFDEEDSAETTALEDADTTDMAAADDSSADMDEATDAANNSGDEGDMSLDAGGDQMAAGPGADGDDDGASNGAANEAGVGASDGDDGGVDTAAAGSEGANTGGAGQGPSGSLVAVGVGDGLSNAISDPTSLDSLADVVVGTDPENGNKDNVAQVTALGGVTNGGSLGVSVLEVLNGDTEDPLGQVLAIDADNPPGAGGVPAVDGIAEINLGDDPDGQTFNVIQVDAFDDNFLPDGSGSLANVSVGDGLDDGFGSLVGISIAENNNGENDDLANVALGQAFEPLADPLSPITNGINDLGTALGAGLAPVLGPLGDAVP